MKINFLFISSIVLIGITLIIIFLPSISALYGNDAYTKVLLHFDGINTSTSIVDSAYGNTTTHTWTAVGNARIESGGTMAGFGNASYCDGNGDYIHSDDSNTEYDSSNNGNFTIDLWVYTTGTSGDIIGWQAETDSESLIRLLVTSSNGVRLLMALPSAWTIDKTVTNVLYANKWTHLAVERWNSNNITLYVNGTPVYSVINNVSNPTGSARHNLLCRNDFGGGGGYYTGWIDEVRFSKGIARYNGTAFTPETAPYTTDADTTKPILNITFPSPDYQNFSSYTITINYTVSDNVALGSCWWTNDSGIINHTITCGNNLTGMTWNQGLNNITFYANDTSGNVGNSSLRYFEIHTCLPLPASGQNWIVNYEDNCTITTFLNMGGGNLTLQNGPGTFTQKAGIVLHQRTMTCSSAPCSYIFYPMLVYT